MKIKHVEFSPANYFNQETPKKQIYLHHTAGGDNAESVFQWWSNTRNRIATCVVIDSKGTIVQGFSSKKWGYHLGLTTKTFNTQGIRYEQLDKISIGVELCNWGYLQKVGKGKDAKFLNYLNIEVPADQVIELDEPFKGYKYWHSYSPAQIESLKQLLLLWNERYKIPLDYNDDIFDINKRALSAQPGVYTHNSVRKDKFDVYPHPGLIKMLKSLTSKEVKVTEKPKAAAKKPKASASKPKAKSSAKKGK
jgi:hypothetical protein